MKTYLTMVVALLFLASTAVLAGSGGTSPAQQSDLNNFAQETGQLIPGKYIVVLTSNKGKGLPLRSSSEVQSIALSVGAQPKNVYSAVLEGFSGPLSDAQVRELLNTPIVDYIEPDRTITMIAQTVPWVISQVNAQVAHGRGVRGAAVKVGIIDTGIDYTHPDLSANYYGGTDFVNGDSDPMDDEGHGTHVSGTVAAIDNSIGVLGVAPSAHLYGIKVLDRFGNGTVSDVIAGIDVAAANGMQVVNISHSQRYILLY